METSKNRAFEKPSLDTMAISVVMLWTLLWLQPAGSAQLVVFLGGSQAWKRLTIYILVLVGIHLDSYVFYVFTDIPG